MTTQTDLVVVRDLSIALQATGEEIVCNTSFSIKRGEVVGVVGESGSGKTSMGMTLLGFLRRGAYISSGTVEVAGTDMRIAAPKTLQQMRGRDVAYIPQDPAMALSPRLSIGSQLREMIRAHRLNRDEGEERIATMMQALDLPIDKAFLRKFPHQLSGGQKQRICIAMAFLLRPQIVMLDEPTTGLDVLTQMAVLEVVRRLCQQYQVAALYVTHDLAVIATIAHRILVMKSGQIIETGTTEEIFKNPTHPYTRDLIACAPDIDRQHDFAAKIPAQPKAPPNETKIALSVDTISAHYGHVPILHDVSLDVAAGECLALVGQSGSGKTTLARTIIGMHKPSKGSIRLEGQILAATAREREAKQRQKLQYVFQSPFTALNPRRTIAASITAPLLNFASKAGSQNQNHQYRIEELLDLVCLPARVATLYPADLSGGERQRVSIARAMATNPQVLLCDEITSALDVSVQATIIQLLMSLQLSQKLALLFVTHNLALVRSFADRVAVMQHGRLVEIGTTEQVLTAPQCDYTRALLNATPRMPKF